MNSGPTLHPGATGTDVKRVQRLLVMIKLLDFEGIDGSFGPKTEFAVRAFQRDNGLSADGIVGPGTWGAFPEDPNTPVLHLGSHGSVVSALQHGLLPRAADTNPPCLGRQD